MSRRYSPRMLCTALWGSRPLASGTASIENSPLYPASFEIWITLASFHRFGLYCKWLLPDDNGYSACNPDPRAWSSGNPPGSGLYQIPVALITSYSSRQSDGGAPAAARPPSPGGSSRFSMVT